MRTTISLLATAATLALLANQAHAQTTPVVPDESPTKPGARAATTGASDEDNQADIVITATKRETSLQRTPIAVDVIGGAAAQKVGLVSLAAIGTLAPSINFGQSNGPFTTVTIRGVSSQDATELGDPAVAINVDGEYINRPFNLSASLFDLQRVEILRGPQGTLYGRNSTAGAVNVITNKPTDKFSASLTGSAGNYGQLGAEGYINLPIVNGIGLRVSGLVDHHDGYLKSAVGPNLEDGTVKAVRARLLIEPTNRLSLLLTGEYIDNKSAGSATTATLITAPPGTIPRDLIVGPYSRTNVQGGILNPYQNNRQKAVKGELTYDFGFAKFTDIAAYRDTKADYFINQHGLPFFTVDFESHSSYRTFGNEARLTSGKGMPFDWQIGYYHFNEDQGPAFIPVYQAASVYLTRAYEAARTIFRYQNINVRSDAFFGEATVPIGGGFSVTGGIRYTQDSKSRLGTQYLLNLAVLNASAGRTFTYTTVDQSGRVHSKRWTYNAVANWQITPQNLLYAKYTTGYKAGGFTTVGTYEPEDITSYEAGSKNTFANGTITANIAAFLYDYKNQQVQTFQVVSGLQAATTSNAASSRIYGAEFEGIANITPQDRFRLTVDYLHARYKSFRAAVASFGGTNVLADLTGNKAAFAPSWTIGMSYSHTEQGDWGSLTAQLGTVYKSEYYLSAINYRSTLQKGYTKTDFTLTYSDPSDRYSLTAFVRNIENSRVYRYGDFTSAVGYNFFRWQFAQPRTMGVRATVRFE